jgi:hypothetical protein
MNFVFLKYSLFDFEMALRFDQEMYKKVKTDDARRIAPMKKMAFIKKVLDYGSFLEYN